MAINAIKYEIKALLLLSLALFSYSATAFHDHQNGHGGRRGLLAAAGDATVFNVNSYGAKADGKTDNVQAFMKAWNAACKSSGGAAKLVIPAGTYMAGQVAFQGPCTAASPITVEVQGTIIAQTDLSEYPSAEWFSFELIDGLILNGGGTFNGQGEKSWQFGCRGKFDCELLPTSIKFNKVSNAVVHSLSSINSKSFHMTITGSNNVTVHSLNIAAPGESPNTDGIHISHSKLINVSDSVIGTGDDCISIGQGSTDVSISGIKCGPGHGISVGSLGKYKNEEDVSGIFVRNCTLSKTSNGVRIKTWPGSLPSAASGISFEDIIMDQVKNPIIIDQHYGSKKNMPSRVKISDVHYKSIRGTSTTAVAVNFMCSEQVPCVGVQLADIDLSFNGAVTKKTLPFSSSCLNAKVVFGGKMNPPPCP